MSDVISLNMYDLYSGPHERKVFVKFTLRLALVDMSCPHLPGGRIVALNRRSFLPRRIQEGQEGGEKEEDHVSSWHFKEVEF